MHKTLNKKLFDSTERLKLEIRDSLARIAYAFADFANIKSEQIVDIVLVGSSVNYSYSSKGDLDVHIYIPKTDAIPEDYYTTKKIAWMAQHPNIRVAGLPVEPFVAYVGDEVKSGGQYSIIKNDWLVHPVRLDNPKHFNQQIKQEVEKYKEIIGSLIDADAGVDALEVYKERWRELRKVGLASKDGENSYENQLFRALRHGGLFDRVNKYISEKKDTELSLMSEQEREMRKLFNDMILMKIENKVIDMLEVHYPQPTSKKVSSLEQILADHVYWDGENDED
jgi:hypothetical protein